MAPEKATDLPRTGLLTVYGTLKRGFRLNGILKGERGQQAAKFISTCRTVTEYPMITVDVPFPYLYDVPGTGHVVEGEIWEIVDPEMMDYLDYVEGVPHHYQRKTIEVLVDGNAIPITTFVYFINKPFHLEDLACCRPNFERPKFY